MYVQVDRNEPLITNGSSIVFCLLFVAIKRNSKVNDWRYFAKCPDKKLKYFTLESVTNLFSLA